MDATYRRHTRRSHPSLAHLSVTPLTPAYPLRSSYSPPPSRRASYIAPTSLPQTPSLLSRSPSRTRHRTSKSSHALSSLSQTSTSLPRPHSSQLSHSSHPPPTGSRTDHTTWLLQTASLLTTATAEAKGQAWLATRSSSTSLADLPPPPDELLSAYKADDEFSPVSTRWSGPGSRFASRRGSRGGVGTPKGGRMEGEEEGEFFEGVDFVEEGEEEVEEGEMRRVVWGRVGGWVDWAVGWMDFRGDGEEVGGEDGEGEGRMEEVRRRKRDEGDRVVVKRREEVGRLEVEPPEGDGGWKDAAWLLGVAKKVLV